MARVTKPVTKVEVVEEPEIQYAATAELFTEIEQWLMNRGAIFKTSEWDTGIYFDTVHLRLLREGIEYRVKPKGDKYRHDMKTPTDTNEREVVPDENDIVRRNEIKFKTEARKPSLRAFQAFKAAMDILGPVHKRVTDFFGKKLLPWFRSCFFKKKIDYQADEGRVEYSFQTGRMVTMDGKRKTKLLYILELELREGLEAALLKEKQKLEEIFVPRGLIILNERKVILGFELCERDMNEKQKYAFNDARGRNRPEDEGGPEIVQVTIPKAPALRAAA